MPRPLPLGRPVKPVRLASYIVRVIERDGRVEYLVRDLRSGEEHCFADPAELQRWLALCRQRACLH